jgi:hypothetical protein
MIPVYKIYVGTLVQTHFATKQISSRGCHVGERGSYYDMITLKFL